MRKRRFYLLLIAGMALIGVLVVVLRGPREPEYQGRSLSEWVRDYTPAHLLSLSDRGHAEQVAKEAISHIGTNALPWLLEWIRYEPPQWKRKLDEVVETLGAEDFVPENPKSIRAYQAREAFGAVGSQGRGAIPELTALMKDPKRRDCAGRAAIALGAIGGDSSLPPLLAALTNAPTPTRFYASAAIARIGTNARPALPTLIGLLTNGNRIDAISAINTLGNLKLEPKVVVPALVNCLQNTDPPTRYRAARAIGRFGADARDAVPALVQALGDPSSGVQQCASNALREIDPKALEQALNHSPGKKGE